MDEIKQLPEGDKDDLAQVLEALRRLGAPSDAAKHLYSSEQLDALVARMMDVTAAGPSARLPRRPKKRRGLLRASVELAIAASIVVLVLTKQLNPLLPWIGAPHEPQHAANANDRDMHHKRDGRGSVDDHETIGHGASTTRSISVTIDLTAIADTLLRSSDSLIDITLDVHILWKSPKTPAAILAFEDHEAPRSDGALILCSDAFNSPTMNGRPMGTYGIGELFATLPTPLCTTHEVNGTFLTWADEVLCTTTPRLVGAYSLVPVSRPTLSADLEKPMFNGAFPMWVDEATHAATYSIDLRPLDFGTLTHELPSAPYNVTNIVRAPPVFNGALSHWVDAIKFANLYPRHISEVSSDTSATISSVPFSTIGPVPEPGSWLMSLAAVLLTIRVGTRMSHGL